MIESARRLIENGDLSTAETMLTRRVAKDTDDWEAKLLLAIVFAQTARFDRAGSLLQSVLFASPENQEARKWFAAVRKSEGRPEEALEAVSQTLGITPEDPELWSLRGSSLMSLGRAKEATESFEKAAELDPSSAATFANLGLALRLQNRGEEALEAFKRAVELDPEEPRNYFQTFKQLQQLSRWQEAIRILKSGLEKHPGSVLLNQALAATYGRVGLNDEAEEIYRRLCPLSPGVANEYASWLQEQGRFDDSIPVLLHSLKQNPIQGAPYRLLAEARQNQAARVTLIQSANWLSMNSDLDMNGKMHLFYALGKLHEMESDWKSAMQSFDQANELAYEIYPRCRTYDSAWAGREPKLIAQLYTGEFFQRLDQEKLSDSAPIFIVGMIRSGTTLLDQIVSSHPLVVSTGEGTFWNTESDLLHPRWHREPPNPDELRDLAGRYLASLIEASADRRFTDKMPLNYRNLGPILSAFPKAKVLHIRRDPFDTCLSIYTTFFAGGPAFAYRKENIVSFYRAYLEYMEHWRNTLSGDRFFEVDYEDLVTQPQPLIEKILGFLDLPWSDSCLCHEENSKPVTTPSRWQVRQPLYRSSIDKATRYGAYAPEFLQIRG